MVFGKLMLFWNLADANFEYHMQQPRCVQVNGFLVSSIVAIVFLVRDKFPKIMTKLSEKVKL